MIFKSIVNYKQSPTNILNDQLYYRAHIFDIITHGSHTNISVIPTPMNWKTIPITASLSGPPSINNGAHGNEKLLLNTQVSEDYA